MGLGAPDLGPDIARQRVRGRKGGNAPALLFGGHADRLVRAAG